MSAETSHKGEKRKEYTMKFSQNVGRYMNSNSNRYAGTRFKVDVKKSTRIEKAN